MKKVWFIAMFCLLVTMAATAEIDIGAFPVGEWLDANYDAVWTFSSNNIQIIMTDGELRYDFMDKTIQDFSVGTTTEGLVLSFSCVESMRKYSFIKPITNSDIILRIEREGYDLYEVTMPMQ